MLFYLGLLQAFKIASQFCSLTRAFWSYERYYKHKILALKGHNMIYATASPIISNIAISLVAVNLTVICFKRETESVWVAADTTTFCTMQCGKSSLPAGFTCYPPVFAVSQQLRGQPLQDAVGITGFCSTTGWCQQPFPGKGTQFQPLWLLTGSAFTQTAQIGIWQMTGN